MIIGISARNVNGALYEGLRLLVRAGERQDSRAGEVLVVPSPVATTYFNPMERVLFNPTRDANPFFHLMEALWMLAGRNDATWLDQFVSDFSQRFAEAGGHQHGAYGYRWRKHFDMEGGAEERLPDQLQTIIKMLRKNPDDRRVVLTMWDPVADLGTEYKDICCNTHIYFRVRSRVEGHDGAATGEQRWLDITVCCRSNDAVWGAHGANAVHFSVLQEYVAAYIGAEPGYFYQFSNNYHVYTSILEKLKPMLEALLDDRYAPNMSFPQIQYTKIVTFPAEFDQDLSSFFGDAWQSAAYKNPFFPSIAVPLRNAYAMWRSRERAQAMRVLVDQLPGKCDWAVAAYEWMERRMRKAQT
jgi:thymidylate synthase